MRAAQAKAIEPQVKVFSADEYLVLERAADERHEWLDGVIYKMSGESPNHSIINANIITEINIQLRGKPCIVFSPNMKVRSQLMPTPGMKGLFSYPDTMVVCGKPLYHDRYQDVVTNPKVIIEILSKSTMEYDRGEKFDRYAANKSLTDYLLVSQTHARIQHFTRKPRGRWELVTETKLDRSIVIASIKCKLKLAHVYDRIEFPPLELVPNTTG